MINAKYMLATIIRMDWKGERLKQRSHLCLEATATVGLRGVATG